MSVAQEKFSYRLPDERQIEKVKSKRQLSKRAIRRGKIMLTGSIFALFVTGVAVAYYFAQVAAVGLQIGQLQKELTKLNSEQEYLETQANQLMSLQRVEAIATTKLGMVKPNSKEVVLVAALPTSPQEGQKQPTKNVEPQQASGNAAVMAEDKQVGSDTKSPVIEAFTDLVKSWEKKI